MRAYHSCVSLSDHVDYRVCAIPSTVVSSSSRELRDERTEFLALRSMNSSVIYDSVIASAIQSLIT